MPNQTGFLSFLRSDPTFSSCLFFLFASFAAPHTPMQAIAVDLKKFDHIEDRLPMLDNLSADPGKQNDLALSHIVRTRSMLEKLGRWEVQSPNPVFREPHDWRIRHLQFYGGDYPMTQPK